jgi:hypothetical protein
MVAVTRNVSTPDPTLFPNGKGFPRDEVLVHDPPDRACELNLVNNEHEDE